MSDPGIGDNIGIPYAEGITDRLELDYSELLTNAGATIEAVAGLPKIVKSSTDVADIASVIVKLRDLAARSESHRKAEKEPYLRSSEAVDAFFFKRLKEPLDGQRKDLSNRLDRHKQQQLAEERQRREAEAAAARKAQMEAIRVQQEAEAAARRARSIDSQTSREIEAANARVEADMAAVKAEATALATMAKSTTLVGERFEGTERSGQVAMRKMPVVFIEDVAKLDLELLRPYLKGVLLAHGIEGLGQGDWIQPVNARCYGGDARCNCRQVTYGGAR